MYLMLELRKASFHGFVVIWPRALISWKIGVSWSCRAVVSRMNGKDPPRVVWVPNEDPTMQNIAEHMEVIGADGVHVGTVDKVEENRIKLTKKDSGEGSHKGHHHFIDKGLVADVEGNKVRLSAKAAVAVTMEEEK